MHVVDHQTLELGVFVSSDFAEEFRGLAGEHGAVDEFDGAAVIHF